MDSKILILGSFPSIKSRENNFYYGNKHNKFWKILSKFYDCKMPTTINEKIKILSENKIVLWDIVTECDITGSLDSNIKNPKIANLEKIMSKNIKKILCNGQKSYKLLLKHYPLYANIAICLPSTSPANTSFDEKLWFYQLYSYKNTI